MHKELYTISFLRDYMIQKDIISETTVGLEDIFNFFKYISEPASSNKFNSLYILNYINQYIVRHEVSKRKTSARIFEDLIAIILGGIIMDSVKRKNLTENVPEYFNLSKEKIAGNKREKVDILFENGYGISVKTLLSTNNEINLGSFEKNVLFDGLNVTKFLTERKTISSLGLGSIPRITKLLNKIKEEGNYNKFVERFSKMFEFIFSDDILLAIKSKDKLDLYFLKGKKFTKHITSKCYDIEELLKIVNRWEGNNIRMNAGKLTSLSEYNITLDLSKLKLTVVESINKFDLKLHKTYIEYFNSEQNKDLKNDLHNSIDNLFKEFDSDFLKLN